MVLRVPVIRLALASLFEHPLRTALTCLGIIIGVASVCMMMAIGEGAKRSITQQMDSINGRTISVSRNWSVARKNGVWRGVAAFTEADLEELRDLEGVVAVSGNLSKKVNVKVGNSELEVDVRGVDRDWLNANDTSLGMGEFFSPAEFDQGAPVAVLGQSAFQTLFQGQNPIGAKIMISNTSVWVKGVSGKREEGVFRYGDPDNYILLPRKIARNRIIGGDKRVKNHVSGFSLVVADPEDLPRIKTSVESVLKRRRNIRNNMPMDFSIYESASFLRTMRDTARTFRLLLSAIGLISLIVGGVGVMNIMLVSVTERTREIGLRLAVGARRGDILLQFLTEAVMISVISGIIGIMICHGINYFIPDSGSFRLVFSADVAIVSFSAAVCTGIIFGIVPAWQASKLSPIEALRRH